MRPGLPLLSDFWLCLGFFTRIPIPRTRPGEAPQRLQSFPQAVWILPLAAALLGACAALVLAMASALGLPPLLAAPLAVLSLIMLSGALHEDGLADCADGFFGGATRERKLSIMRDSRIGTFGTVALLLSVYLRTASLAVIAGENLGLAAAVLGGGAAVSRTAALMPLVLLPPARDNGLGFTAGKPKPAALAMAASLAILLALLPILWGSSYGRALAALLVAAAAAYAVIPLARQQIGGQTGDVAGAAQQLGEIAYYLAFASQL